jgi:hypothetical protein
MKIKIQSRILTTWGLYHKINYDPFNLFIRATEVAAFQLGIVVSYLS